jgi:cell division protein ZipA
MGLRELLILLLILAIVGVILRGLYVALRASRGQLRMALDKNIPQYDPDELLSSELPNGGARLVQRSFDEVVRRNSEFTSRDQAIPVLMDTVGEDEPFEEAPRQSSVATARNAARQKHGMRTAIKPVQRLIDRMAAVAAAAQAASPAVMSAPAPDTHAAEYFDDALDDEQYEEEQYEEQDDFRSEPMSAAGYRDDDDRDDDLDDDDRDDDLDDDDYEDDPRHEDDDDFEDDEDDQYDDADRDDDAADDNEADDSEDPEDFESWEEDQDGEDDEYEAEEFESVYGDDNTDEPEQEVRASGRPSVEEKAASSADTWYEDEAVPPVDDEVKSGPRRWLQWAGEKLSGKGTTVHDTSVHVTESHERPHRAEPVLGLGSFDDQEEVSAPRNVQAPVRKTREPLDKSRQKELSLDHPDDDILFDREERAAEKVSRMEKPAPQKAAREQVRGQGPLLQQEKIRGQGPLPQEKVRGQGPLPQEPVLQEAVPAASSAPAQDFSEVLVLNVVARPNHEIAGVDLLQVLLANQLRFGDMAIFHRHVDGAARSPVLFSVANLVNPGTFDLNRISEFSTRGVCFFMTLPSVGNNMQAFDKMLEAAQQVRIALDADLKDDNRSVMTAQTIEHYRQRVRDFDLRQLRQPK